MSPDLDAIRRRWTTNEPDGDRNPPRATVDIRALLAALDEARRERDDALEAEGYAKADAVYWMRLYGQTADAVRNACADTLSAEQERDRLTAAIQAMDKRIRAGGPSNYLDLAERYMAPDVAEAVRAAVGGGISGAPQ